MSRNCFIIMLLMLISGVKGYSQSDGDKLIGTYLIDYEGHQSKVKFYKYEDGYRAQNYWVNEPTNADGTPKRDLKNPDKKKRNVLMSEVVLIDKVVYKNGEWCDGEIYDPTSGKFYDIKMKFDDDNTLHLRGGMWGLYLKSLIWKRL